jgi:hypothetical protein
VYGALERKVEQGVATDAEIWRWANKIHYGLEYKDRFLEWDRKNLGRKIGEVINVDDPVEKDRHFLHCVSGDFKVHPDPFGSVFKFEFATAQEFAFAHIKQSSSICVSLGSTGYVVFVTDAQALRNSESIASQYRMLKGRGRREDMLFFFAQCVELLSRSEIGHDMAMSEGMLARLGPTVVHRLDPPNPERFRYMCSLLGLNWIDNEPKTVDEARSTILSVLGQRGISVSDEFKRDLTSCDDLAVLKEWINRLPNFSSTERLRAY